MNTERNDPFDRNRSKSPSASQLISSKLATWSYSRYGDHDRTLPTESAPDGLSNVVAEGVYR
jgi:hypothetical protein